MNKVSREKHVTLNLPALWKAVPGDSINTRTYTSNRTYLEGQLVSVASNERPITRYVKTFTKGKKDFSLFMFSDESDLKKISDFFDGIVKKLTIESVSKSLISASSDGFTYLDTYYKEKK